VAGELTNFSAQITSETTGEREVDNVRSMGLAMELNSHGIHGLPSHLCAIQGWIRLRPGELHPNLRVAANPSLGRVWREREKRPWKSEDADD